MTQALTFAIAIMLAIFVTLVTANVALAWMVDTEEISDTLSIRDLEEEQEPQEPRLYAAIYDSTEGAGYELVITEGIPAEDDERKPYEVFYDFLDGASSSVQPWAVYAPDLRSAEIRCSIRPISTTEWFAGCANLHSIVGLERIDASGLVEASGMFRGCALLVDIDVSSWNTDSLLRCDELFSGCTNLKRSDLSQFHLAPGSTMPKQVFAGCTSLVEFHVSPAMVFEHGSIPTPVNQDTDGLWFPAGEGDGIAPEEVVERVQANYRRSDGEVLVFYAYGKAYAAIYGSKILVLGRGVPPASYEGQSLKITYRGIEDGKEDFANITGSYPPWSTYRSTLVKVVSLTENKIKPLRLAGWFAGSKLLAQVDLSALDTQNVTTMKSAFSDCRILEELDVSEWDMSSVTDAENMFYACSVLKKLDTSHWDTSNITTMSQMFYCCHALEKLDISGWDVNKVISFNRMFLECWVLSEADMSRWRRSPDGVDNTVWTNIYAMFSSCRTVKALDFSWLAGRKISTNTGGQLFETVYALRDVWIPPSIALSTAAGSYSDPKGTTDCYWYIDGKGEPYTSKQLVAYTNNRYNTMQYGEEAIHWSRDRVVDEEQDSVLRDEMAAMAMNGDINGEDVASLDDPSKVNEERGEIEESVEDGFRVIESPEQGTRELSCDPQELSVSVVPVRLTADEIGKKGGQIRMDVLLMPVE